VRGYRVALLRFPDLAANRLAAAAASLTTSGYAVIEAALPSACWSDLGNEGRRLLEEQAFSKGRIGSGSGRHYEGLVRGDSLCWLESVMPVGGAYLRWMEDLRVTLNRALFLGLTCFEAHYAHFPIGAAYGSHQDRYGDSNARVLSTVLYCNQDWPGDAGGELVIYDDQNRTRLTLAPQGGTLILFLSAGNRHEAKVSTRARWSIAGWFRAGDGRPNA
jgi:SM-20-related protein